jgi:ABC-2 type transport system permease protein
LSAQGDEARKEPLECMMNQPFSWENWNRKGLQNIISYREEEYDRLKNNLKESEFYALLYIPSDIYSTNQAQLISEKQLPFEVIEQISGKLSRYLENEKRQKILDETGIPDLDERLKASRTSIKINTLKVSDKGQARKAHRQ